LEEDVEESDEREGFSVGGVNERVGSTRDGGMGGGVLARLPARDRAGLENGERVRDAATVLDACEELVVVSVEALLRCSKRKLEEGREVVELVDGRRVRKEDSRVYIVLDDSAGVEWDSVGEEGPGEGEGGDRGGR
jgi:hypothetical protein